MKHKKITTIILLLLAFALGATTLFVGQFYSIVPLPKQKQASVDQESNKKDLAIVRAMIKDNYYRDVDKKVLQEGACRGMVEALNDPYSRYLNKEEFEAWMASIHGSFEGIGVTFYKNEKGEIVILTVHEGTPAQAAGLKADDRILSVDGKTYDDVELMSHNIRGEKGTYVTLKLQRGDKKFEKKIKREKVVLPTVTSKMLEDGIGMIAINAFEDNTTKEFEQAVKNIKNKGAKSFVLDLRNNGGGLINNAIEISDLLLGKCEITTIKDRDGKVDTFTSDADQIDMKYVVLVNQGTASAAEILTAAIKGNEAAKIIGVKTYGKGVIQQTKQLPSGGGLKLTTNEYVSPTGEQIHEKGITPDIKESDSDKQVSKAIELLKK